MSDLIERQAAIDAINSHFGFNIEEEYGSAVQEVINGLPSAQPEQRWIPCSEELPEENHWLGGSGKQFSDEVLVNVVNYDDEDMWVYISQTIDGRWALELPRHCEVTAWRELPEPYRGEKNEKSEERKEESAQNVPKEDLISRKAAIDALDPLFESLAIDKIKALPSAQPEQTDCEYCHEDSDGYIRPIEKNSHAWLVRQGRTMKLRVCFKGGYSECDILFCPMCGRRLTDG